MQKSCRKLWTAPSCSKGSSIATVLYHSLQQSPTSNAKAGATARLRKADSSAQHTRYGARSAKKLPSGEDGSRSLVPARQDNRAVPTQAASGTGTSCCAKAAEIEFLAKTVRRATFRSSSSCVSSSSCSYFADRLGTGTDCMHAQPSDAWNSCRRWRCAALQPTSDAESPCIWCCAALQLPSHNESAHTWRCAALQLTKLSNDNREAVAVGGVSSGAVAIHVEVAPSL